MFNVRTHQGKGLQQRPRVCHAALLQLQLRGWFKTDPPGDTRVVFTVQSTDGMQFRTFFEMREMYIFPPLGQKK